MKQEMKMMAVAIIAVFAFSAFAFVTANVDDADADDTVFVDSTTGLSYVLLADTTNVEVKATTPAELVGTISIPAKIYVTGSVASETQTEGSLEYTVTKVADNGFNGVKITGVTLPEGLKAIGTTAFYKGGLTSVTIPASVETLGAGCFNGITSLTSITFADTSANSPITVIPMSFAASVHATSITLPESIKTIEDTAFYGSGLTNITIPASVETLGKQCFNGCASLTSIALSEGIKTIGDSAFSRCGLTSITIPASVETLGAGCFSGCASLTSIAFANGSQITAIPENFVNNAHVTSITLPESIKTIGTTAFYKSGLTSITIPASVETVEAGCFNGCTSLTSITFADTSVDSPLKVIPMSFAASVPATSITLPESIETIEDTAFYGSGLTSITIPQSVTTIGKNAFFNTPLAVIDVKGTVTLGEDSLNGAGKKLPAFVGYYPLMSETITGIYKAIYTPVTYKVTINVTANGEFWAKSGSELSFGMAGTPLEMNLEAGEQEITLSSMGYQSETVTVTVLEDGSATVNVTLTEDDTNIALDRTAQSIQQALDDEKKTIYVRTNSNVNEKVNIADEGTEIIIERTVDGEDITFSGDFTFGDSKIELYNVKFDAAGEFISIKSGSIELYGDIFDGVIVLSGEVKLVGDVNLGDGVTIVFKDGSTLDTNGYMFNFFGMPSVQTSSATVTEAFLATYGFTNFISVDPIGEEPITTIFAVDGDKYLDITIENPIGTEVTADYTGYYIGKWTLVNAEQNAVYYGDDNGSLAAGATKMYLEVGDVPNGNYLLTISFLKNDGEAVAVSVDKPVSINQGIILGMYYDGNDYHAIVKNLAGALTADTTIYAGAFYVKSIPGTQIDYVAYHPDALSATVTEDLINDVDFKLEASATFVEDPIAFNPKYVTSDAVYYGAQTLSHYDAKDPLSHAVSYLKFNGEYALYAYAIGPVAETVYTLTAHYTDGGDIVTATYTYQMNESGYVEINLAEDFKNDSAEFVDLTADGITVIYFDIAGTEGTTEKIALEALTLNI